MSISEYRSTTTTTTRTRTIGRADDSDVETIASTKIRKHAPTRYPQIGLLCNCDPDKITASTGRPANEMRPQQDAAPDVIPDVQELS